MSRRTAKAQRKPENGRREKAAPTNGGPVEPRLLKEKDAAVYLGTSPGSLRMDRHDGNLGIPWVRFGKRGIRYDRQVLEELIAARTVRPENAGVGGM